MTTPERKYKQMIDGIEDYSIILLDPEGNIESWNKGAQKIKGYGVDEIDGRNFSCFYPPEDQANGRPLAYLAEAARLGHTQHEGWRVRKDNTQFWAHVTITALRDDEDQVIGFSKVTYDRTDRLRQQEMDHKIRLLEARNKETEQFAYIASHDLLEPLNTVGSFIMLLREDYKDKIDSTGLEYIGLVESSVSRMKELITALLYYARIGKDRQLATVDCNALLASVLVDMKARIDATGAQVTYSHMPAISAYPLELRQLFQNLISNAIKFTRPGVQPVVKIAAKHRGNIWTFSVADNGIGIPEKDYEKIFVIFKRLHKVEEYEGSGIGLAHCKKIVEMHNGNIWVEPAPAGGTRFFFTIIT